MISRLINLLDVAREMRRIERRQEAIMRQQERWMEQTQLESLRCQRDLVLGWRISLERPEVDIRDDLSLMYRDLSDQIARIEEHVLS